jgi:hypothetical protein
LHDDQEDCKRDDNPLRELIHVAVNLHAIGIPPCLPPLDPGAKAGSESDYQNVKAE